MADVRAKEPAARRRVPQKGRWLPVVVGAAAAGMLAAVAWFGLHFFRDSAYEDERAFRILGHIVGQFGNFQGAVAGALQLVPTSTYAPPDRDDRDETSKYQSTLALREVTLSTDKDCPPSGDSNPEFRIDLQRAFSMCRVACRVAPETGRRCPRGELVDLTLSGPLAAQLPAFIFQDFFDSVAITTGEGVTLASVPRGQERGHQVQLHQVAAVDPLGGDADGLLQRAALHIASGSRAKELADAIDESTGEEVPVGPLPGYATVFNDRIGVSRFASSSCRSCRRMRRRWTELPCRSSI